MVPRMVKIMTHSALIDLISFSAACGLPWRNAGMNLNLFAAASASSSDTNVDFKINVWP